VKKIEVTKDDFTEDEIKAAVERKANTSKEYLFKRTYIGMLGAFHNGQKYVLTEEQYKHLKGDVE
jgi:hypothetical protein